MKLEEARLVYCNDLMDCLQQLLVCVLTTFTSTWKFPGTYRGISTIHNGQFLSKFTFIDIQVSVTRCSVPCSGKLSLGVHFHQPFQVANSNFHLHASIFFERDSNITSPLINRDKCCIITGRYHLEVKMSSVA